MKTIILSLLTVFTLNSCATNHNNSNDEKENTMVNKEMEHQGSKILVGEIDKSSFGTPNYQWYNEYHDSYDVDKTIIDSFKNKLNDYHVKIFMGTWCSDSQRETPYFFKIMEYADFPESKISMYAVDRDMHSLSNEENGMKISHVPTFIFYKNDTEVGRIVESPINSLEEDIRDIVNGNPQTPNYAQ